MPLANKINSYISNLLIGMFIPFSSDPLLRLTEVLSLIRFISLVFEEVI